MMLQKLLQKLLQILPMHKLMIHSSRSFILKHQLTILAILSRLPALPWTTFFSIVSHHVPDHPEISVCFARNLADLVFDLLSEPYKPGKLGE